MIAANSDMSFQSDVSNVLFVGILTMKTKIPSMHMVYPHAVRNKPTNGRSPPL